MNGRQAQLARGWPPEWASLGRPHSWQARCAEGTLDPDEWFPVGLGTSSARQEAAAAIAVCATCLVRAECLEFSLEHWKIGQHGIWGGLVPGERAALRQVSQHGPDHPGGRLRAVSAPRFAAEPPSHQPQEES